MNKLKTLLAVPLVLLSGCIYYITQPPAPNSYYVNPAKDIHQIGRVTLVELTNYSAVHQISADVTESLFQEIQKKQIFGVTKMQQTDPVWRSLQVGVEGSYAYDDLVQMQKMLKCDAILTGVITAFEPYPHMTIGLRLQLIDLSDGQLIWALEQVWDTTDKSVQNRIEAYYNPKRLIFADENLGGQLGSVSSLKFFKFVSYEITKTLNGNH